MDLIITSSQNINKSAYLHKRHFGKYDIYIKEVSTVNHYFEKEIGDTLCVIFGSYFWKTSDPVQNVHDMFVSKGSKAVMELDGSFVYAEISLAGELTVFTEREGLLPLYYRMFDKNICVTSEQSLLFEDFCEGDLDISSVYDFIHYGMLIGEHTYSEKVKALPGGCSLSLGINGNLKTEQLYFFHYSSECEAINEKELFTQIKESYENAIRKRIDRSVKEIVLLTSGGMDSRMVLASLNNVTDEKVDCVGFGQAFSEELDNAAKVADLKKNKFSSVFISPNDFIKDSEEYLRIVCGNDMAPQSHIIDRSKAIREMGYTAFMTGTILEAQIGGTYLTQEAIDTKEKFSQFIPKNLSPLHCLLMEEEEIKGLFHAGQYDSLFSQAGVSENLIKEAEKYDEYEAKDVIQSFVINTRAKRVILNREAVPSTYMDYLNPNFDIDFQKAIAKIPAERRLGRHFYRDYFVDTYPEYAQIVYNNTTLPISADFNLWKQATELEAQREKLFEKMQKTNVVYYPHYYSDFNGYMRYDASWKCFFDETLFSKDSYLVGKYISRDAVKKMYDDHLSYKANNRNKLVNLASMELFLSKIMK